MTREEEIRNKAIKDQKSCMGSMEWRAGFISGAKWADKHSKRYNQDELCDIQLEMMKQRDKRLIDRALSWLHENIEYFVEVKQSLRSSYEEFHLTENFDKEFKKVMEG